MIGMIDRKLEEYEKIKKELDSEINEQMGCSIQSLSPRIAKDGKPYHIDHVQRDLGPGEVELIQFLRPNARRRRMFAFVGERAAEKAENLILSCEDLGNGKIAIWVRKIGDPLENERLALADNGPGADEPTKVLVRLIYRVSESNGE